MLWKVGVIFRKCYLFVVREYYWDVVGMASVKVWYMIEVGDVLKV